MHPLSRLASTACSLVLLLASSAPVVHAAEAPEAVPRLARINVQVGTPVMGDILLGPSRFLLPMRPGEERTVDVEVTNRTGADVVLRTSTEDFASDPEQGGAPAFFEQSIDGPYTARGWLTPEYATFLLKPDERAYIPVTVRVPADADAGDHQAALILEKVSTARVGPGITIVPRLASLFVVTVAGDVTRDARLTTFRPQRTIFWSLPVRLTLAGRNDGTVHFRGQGRLGVRNFLGVTVDESPIRDWVVLRGSARERELTWQPLFALGRYTATATVTLFEGGPPAQVRTSFWVIPLLPLLFGLLAVFVVSFAVQYVFSRFEIRRKAG